MIHNSGTNDSSCSFSPASWGPQRDFSLATLSKNGAYSENVTHASKAESNTFVTGSRNSDFLDSKHAYKPNFANDGSINAPYFEMAPDRNLSAFQFSNYDSGQFDWYSRWNESDSAGIPTSDIRNEYQSIDWSIISQSSSAFDPGEGVMNGAAPEVNPCVYSGASEEGHGDEMQNSYALVTSPNNRQSPPPSDSFTPLPVYRNGEKTAVRHSSVHDFPQEGMHTSVASNFTGDEKYGSCLGGVCTSTHKPIPMRCPLETETSDMERNQDFESNALNGSYSQTCTDTISLDFVTVTESSNTPKVVTSKASDCKERLYSNTYPQPGHLRLNDVIEISPVVKDDALSLGTACIHEKRPISLNMNSCDYKTNDSNTEKNHNCNRSGKDSSFSSEKPSGGSQNYQRSPPPNQLPMSIESIGNELSMLEERRLKKAGPENSVQQLLEELRLLSNAKSKSFSLVDADYMICSGVTVAGFKPRAIIR